MTGDEERIYALEQDVAKLKGALGSLALSIEGSVHGITTKLDQIDPDSPEAFYFLATYGLDACRKLDFIYEALKEFAPFATQDVTVQSWRDSSYVYTKRIDDHDLTWTEIAHRVDEKYFAVLQRISAEYDALLRQRLVAWGINPDNPDVQY